MDARKERGRELAQRGRIVKLTQGWRVPSQSGSGSYFVRLTKKPSCTYSDFEYWQLPCKHIYAVEYLITWQTETNGPQTVTTKTDTNGVRYCIFFVVPYSKWSRDLAIGGEKSAADYIDSHRPSGTRAHVQDDYRPPPS